MATKLNHVISATKPWYKSKTLIFNVVAGVLGAAEVSFKLLQPHMEPFHYAIAFFVILLINAGLRVVTKQELTK